MTAGGWLPRSFMGWHDSSGFSFRTHKGQSQFPPAGIERYVWGAAGFPSLLGPTNREARTSNPSSTRVDRNSGAEPRGAALYGVPVSQKWREIQRGTAHSWSLPASTFPIPTTSGVVWLTIKYSSNLKLL